MAEFESTEAILAGSVDDLRPGQARVVVGTEPRIAVFNVNGAFFATDDTCTHAKSSLAEDGYVEGDVVECGYHYARFCVRDGRVLSPPANTSLQTYVVTVAHGKIYVHAPGVRTWTPAAEVSHSSNTVVTSATNADPREDRAASMD